RQGGAALWGRRDGGRGRLLRTRDHGKPHHDNKKAQHNTSLLSLYGSAYVVTCLSLDRGRAPRGGHVPPLSLLLPHGGRRAAPPGPPGRAGPPAPSGAVGGAGLAVAGPYG